MTQELYANPEMLLRRGEGLETKPEVAIDRIGEIDVRFAGAQWKDQGCVGRIEPSSSTRGANAQAISRRSLTDGSRFTKKSMQAVVPGLRVGQETLTFPPPASGSAGFQEQYHFVAAVNVNRGATWLGDDHG